VRPNVSGKSNHRFPPDRKANHEAQWHYRQRVALRKQIDAAVVSTETDREGREWVVRRLPDFFGMEPEVEHPH